MGLERRDELIGQGIDRDDAVDAAYPYRQDVSFRVGDRVQARYSGVVSSSFISKNVDGLLGMSSGGRSGDKSSDRGYFGNF